MQKIQFDYFRGMEAEQYHFYRVPKVLFTAECFKSLSCEAKVLYGLMLDRMSLSVKNRWFDEEDRVYIIFTVEEIMELLGCARQKAIRNIAELDTEKGIGLIEKKRLGLGKPNVIYVKNFMIMDCPEPEKKEKQPENAGNTQKYENQTSRSMKTELPEVPESNFQKYENQTSGSTKTKLQEVPESNFRKYENRTSRGVKIILPEVPKSNGNKTDNNNTEYSDIDFSKTDISDTEDYLSYPSYAAGKTKEETMDEIERMNAYRTLIRENISYEAFEHRGYGTKEEVDELVELMVEAMMLPKGQLVRIAGADRPAEIVKSRFMQLRYPHIEYVTECLKNNTTKVGNIKAYLLTTLYNSVMTMDHYYHAEVNHDLYGGG